MSRRPLDDSPPESDRFEEAPHPRETMELFGHKAAEAEFLDAYRAGRLPQAWLIGGREGVGKATLAWRVARFVLAHPDPRLPDVQRAADLSVPADHPSARRVMARSHPDVNVLRREWDPKSKKHFTEIRVDDVRKTIDMFHHAAGEGGWRVAIVDSADDLNRSSANALLKVIEEPPPRSLFLIVAHQPARIMPTIRSRCRRQFLSALAPVEVASALRALGEPWDETPDAALNAAALRSGGSVRDALKLLSGDSLALIDSVERLLRALPNIDWARVHELAEATQGRDGLDGFESFMAAVFDWLDAFVQEGAAASLDARRLAPLAEVWEKIAASARETQALNLDRRPLVLSIFSDLALAVRTARA